MNPPTVLVGKGIHGKVVSICGKAVKMMDTFSLNMIINEFRCHRSSEISIAVTPEGAYKANITMEMGDSLSTFLNESNATKVVRDLIHHLSTLESMGIIHGDIKPDNIVIFGGKAMLVDFSVIHCVSQRTEIESQDSQLEVIEDLYQRAVTSTCATISRILQTNFEDASTFSELARRMGVTLVSPTFPPLTYLEVPPSLMMEMYLGCSNGEVFFLAVYAASLHSGGTAQTYITYALACLGLHCGHPKDINGIIDCVEVLRKYNLPKIPFIDTAFLLTILHGGFCEKNDIPFYPEPDVPITKWVEELCSARGFDTPSTVIVALSDGEYSLLRRDFTFSVEEHNVPLLE